MRKITKEVAAAARSRLMRERVGRRGGEERRNEVVE